MYNNNNINISEDTTYSSSEYRRLDLLLSQSSRSNYNNESHLTSFTSFSKTAEMQNPDMQKCVSTESNSITDGNVPSFNSFSNYQKCQHLKCHASNVNHLHEGKDLQSLTNKNPLHNIFLPGILTERSDGVSEQSTQSSNISCYCNVSRTCQCKGTANLFARNNLSPNSTTDNLVLQYNVSQPYNYSWDNPVGHQEPYQNTKHSCTSESKLVSKLIKKRLLCFTFLMMAFIY